MSSLRAELEEYKSIIEEKERQYVDLKRKCDAFEAREEEDRRKRRDISNGETQTFSYLITTLKLKSE